MKKIVSLFLVIVMVLSLTACGGAKKEETSAPAEAGSSAPAEAPVKARELKFSTAVPVTSAWHKGAEHFANTVTEKTNGKFTFTIHPSDELSGGNQGTGIELLQTGATDIHLQDAMVWSSVATKCIVACFPWLLPTYEDVDKYMAGEGGEMLKQTITDAGCVCLAVGENGYRQVVNTRNPIETPEDMAALKMRVPGSNVHVNLLKYIGADPLTMSQSEVYTSLQQGTIDACENTLDLLFTQNTLEVVDYLTLWNYSYDPIFLSVSNKLWNELTDEEKVIFQEAADEAMKIEVEAARAVVADLLTQFDKYPEVEVIEELSAEQLAAFQEAVAPIYEDYREEIGEDFFAAFGYTFE